jgi:hypothetical protein
MKNLALALVLSAVCGHAQTNLTLTNDVPIGNTGFRFSLWNPESKSTTVLFADQTITVFSTNTTTNRLYFILVPRGAAFVCDVQTTNGEFLPETAYGRSFFKEAKLPLSLYNARDVGIANLPILDSYRFPSNGEYILETRIRWWDRQTRKLEVSEPVRVKIIKRDTNGPPVSLKPRTIK